MGKGVIICTTGSKKQHHTVRLAMTAGGRKCDSPHSFGSVTWHTVWRPTLLVWYFLHTFSGWHKQKPYWDECWAGSHSWRVVSFTVSWCGQFTSCSRTMLGNCTHNGWQQMDILTGKTGSLSIEMMCDWTVWVWNMLLTKIIAKSFL